MISTDKVCCSQSRAEDHPSLILYPSCTSISFCLIKAFILDHVRYKVPPAIAQHVGNSKQRENEVQLPLLPDFLPLACSQSRIDPHDHGNKPKSTHDDQPASLFWLAQQPSPTYDLGSMTLRTAPLPSEQPLNCSLYLQRALQSVQTTSIHSFLRRILAACCDYF